MSEPTYQVRQTTEPRGPIKWPDVTHRAVYVWFRDFKVWLTYYKASLIGNLGEPLLYLLAMGLGLGKMVGTVNGIPYIAFLAPGLMCSAAMYTATFECTFGAFTRMTRQQTYDAILATPVSLDEIVLGEILWGSTKSLFSGVAMLLVMSLFGLVKSFWALLALPLVILVGLLFSSLSMIVTAKSQSYDFFSYYFTLGIAPMFLFSGIFFPIENLPEWAQTMAWFLPLTHGVTVSRALFTGTVSLGHLADILWLAVFFLIAFTFAVGAVRKRLIL